MPRAAAGCPKPARPDARALSRRLALIENGIISARHIFAPSSMCRRLSPEKWPRHPYLSAKLAMAHSSPVPGEENISRSAMKLCDLTIYILLF